MRKNTDTTGSESVEPGGARQQSAGSQFGAMILSTSWRVALPMLTLSLGGNGIDRAFDTRPAFSLVGLLLGCAGATVLIRSYMKTQESKGATV